MMYYHQSFVILVAFLVTQRAVVVNAQDCNICGDGNSIQFPTGVVTITYQGEERKNNCETWQKVVQNPVAISDDFCRNEMLAYTAVPCRCTTPSGDQVEVVTPTISPAPTPVKGAAVSAEEEGDGSEGESMTSPDDRNATTTTATSDSDGTTNRCMQEGATNRCNNETGAAFSAARTSTSSQTLSWLFAVMAACAAALSLV